MLLNKQRRKIIKSTVSIHDRTQVETVFSYYLNPDVMKGTEHRYRVDAFLFFPVQTGVNQTSYTRQQFYGDLRSFIRLREPRFSFKELLGMVDTQNARQSPLVFMQKFLKTCGGKLDSNAVKFATEEARVFGSSYVSYFWRRVERRSARLTLLEESIKAGTAENPKALSESFVNNTFKFFEKGHQLLRLWRNLYEEAKQTHPEKIAALIYEMELVNEYNSYCFRDGLLKILKLAEEAEGILENSERQRLIKKVRAYLRLERLYYTKHSFAWVYEDSAKVLKENYIYRRGALKRRIWSVLYLNPRVDLIFKFQKHIGPMIAAGMAGSWALFTSLFLLSQSGSFGSGSRGMEFIRALSMGSLTMLVSASVLAYVLKDRIKEIGKSWFERGLFRSRPDLRNKIYYTNAAGQKLKIGEMKEFVDFDSPEKIPPRIVALRKANLQKYYRFEDAYGAVIHYRKFINLLPQELQKVNHPLRAVHDIIRLNIGSYLQRLDDPIHMAFAPTHEGKAVEVQMPKVYHLDFILKYYPLSKDPELEGAEVIDYYRIVVDKQGMARIEQLK